MTTLLPKNPSASSAARAGLALLLLVAACGTSSRSDRAPPAAGGPAPAGPVAVPTGAPPAAPGRTAVAIDAGPVDAAAAPAPTLPPPSSRSVPVLGDEGIVGLTAEQMTSAAALRAAFPAAWVEVTMRRYCPPGIDWNGGPACGFRDDAPAAPTVPPEQYDVITLGGKGDHGGEWRMTVVADHGRPVDIELDIDKLGRRDVPAMPVTYAAASRWRAATTCAFARDAQEPWLVCRYRGSKLRVHVDGPSEDGEGSVIWLVELDELPAWLAQHGDARVRSIGWGDGLGDRLPDL